jgi:hypothetical protein
MIFINFYIKSGKSSLSLYLFKKSGTRGKGALRPDLDGVFAEETFDLFKEDIGG